MWCISFVDTLASAVSVDSFQKQLGWAGRRDPTCETHDGPSSSCLDNQQTRVALPELPGFQQLQRCWQGRAAATRSSLLLFLEGSDLGVVLPAMECRAWKYQSCHSVRSWLELPGLVSLGVMGLVLGCLGAWNCWVGFCHLFASPSCGSYWNWTAVKLAAVISFDQQSRIFYSG